MASCRVGVLGGDRNAGGPGQGYSLFGRSRSSAAQEAPAPAFWDTRVLASVRPRTSLAITLYLYLVLPVSLVLRALRDLLPLSKHLWTCTSSFVCVRLSTSSLSL